MSTVKLRISYADGRIEDREFGRGRYRLGRDTGDVVLGDPNTSAVHAELDVEPPLARLTDAGSTNGTFDAAGARLSAPYVMRPGEPLRLGSTQLTLLATQPTKGGTQVMGQVPDMRVAPGPAGYGPPPGAPAPQYGAPPGAPAPQYGAPPGAPAPQYGAPPGGDPSAAAFSYGSPAPALPGTGGPVFAPALLPGNSAPTMDYALWPNRVIGYLIDYALVMLCMGVMYGIFTALLLLSAAASSTGESGAQAAGGLMSGACCTGLVLFPLATLAIGIWNRVYLVSKRGYSIGQGVSKLRVVDAAGQRLTFGTAFLRLLAQLVLSMLPFGLVLDMLWPLFDERRQTLHDKAVNCFVINAPA